MKLSWKLAFVTESKGTRKQSLRKLLQSPNSSLVTCLNCDSSLIRLMQGGRPSQTLYTLALAGDRSSVPLEELWNEKIEAMIVPEKQWLTSERYFSDLQFAKDATFYHVLKNSHPTQALELVTQDYLRDSMRPYLHQLTIRVRFFGDITARAKFIGRENYRVDQVYLRDGDECIVTISELVIPPLAELVITFGVKKSMIQFEQYEKDP